MKGIIVPRGSSEWDHDRPIQRVDFKVSVMGGRVTAYCDQCLTGWDGYLPDFQLHAARCAFGIPLDAALEAQP